MDREKQQQNEKEFGSWKKLSGGGRRYWYEVEGRYGWRARYVKEGDINEVTRKFYQEIYDEKGELIEVHWKYPADRGHQGIK